MKKSTVVIASVVIIACMAILEGATRFHQVAASLLMVLGFVWGYYFGTQRRDTTPSSV